MMTQPKLSILMPALPERREARMRGIERDLRNQMGCRFKLFDIKEDVIVIRSVGESVELVIDEGPGTHGAKMSRLMAGARGEYVCAVDDDDRVAGCYVAEILKALEERIDTTTAANVNWRTYDKPDVVTFNLLRVDLAEVWEFRHEHKDRTEMVFNGQQPPGIWTSMPVLGMAANHLCAWRREIAQAVPWPDQNRGADVVWYTEVKRRFPNLREAHVPKILYIYDFDPAATATQKEGA